MWRSNNNNGANRESTSTRFDIDQFRLSEHLAIISGGFDQLVVDGQSLSDSTLEQGTKSQQSYCKLLLYVPQTGKLFVSVGRVTVCLVVWL